MKWRTQIEAARKGIVTAEMEQIAIQEGKDVGEVADLVACGHIAIPANRNHKSLIPRGVGKGLSTKINVNLGISQDCADYEVELEKTRVAIDMGVEAIMDLSCHGNTRNFRRRLVEMSPAMIGTVPMYDAIGFLNKELAEIKEDEFFDVVEAHAEDGVDFMTIHAGINRRTVERFKSNPRLTNIVSRGGSLLYRWMELTGKENPFYENYDRLLDIFQRYDVTVSLGDACRPGSIADATDASQVEELITLGELAKKAWEKNVQVIIEGPGHMAINEIEANVKLQKKLCHGAPFYVLGPIVTDIAPGYDHITSAIGGAIAASAGADFLCYVTPAEHLRLPSLEDMKEGIIAARIAAHAADIAKGIKGAEEWDGKMSKARAALDWEDMFSLAIDPEKARSYRESSKYDGSTCTMCGKMCAVNNMNKTIAGK
ncbi:MAG: phosphomethylpyrimidine synthase ThiC [Bacillota bacterium]